MDPLLPILASYGINISSAAIFELIKMFFAEKPEADREEFKSALVALLRVHNANVAAEGVINILVGNGDIVIDGSKIYSRESVSYKSSAKAKFRVGDQTTSATPKSSVDLEKGAFVEGQGGGEIELDKDGNIIFRT